MLAHLRARKWPRPALAAFALLALTLKILVPPGYMPGTSLAQPIILCAGQGPMPGMAMDHGHPAPDKSPHDSDHPCVFAELGAVGLAAVIDPPDVLPAAMDRRQPAIVAYAVAPGRGMAAPPPPSHAPPLRRA